MSIESRNRCTKDEDITVFYNWLRRILSSTANASTYNMILRELLLSIILLSFIFPLIDVFAQHMMMPPDASVGNRKIMLSLQAEPANIISSQKVMTKLAFRCLSEYFHAHNGKINIDFRPNRLKHSRHFNC